MLVGSRFGSSGMKVYVITNGPWKNPSTGIGAMLTFDVAWMILSCGTKNSGGHWPLVQSKKIVPLGVVLGGRVNASTGNSTSSSHARSMYGGHIWR
jgi:hypothetical protein